MGALQITFYAFRTELALVKREFHPGLETDHLIFFHDQLDPALLAAEAAMRFHHAIRHGARIQANARSYGPMRSKVFGDFFRGYCLF